jgi:hypothetical protein
MIETIDLAEYAIFSQGRQDFALGVCNFPAWPFRIKISRTFLVDIVRAIHYLPAGIFASWQI